MSRNFAKPIVRSGPRPDSRSRKTRQARRRPPAVLFLLAVFFPCLDQAPARAEERVRVQGLVDAEAWNTGSDPSYLTRNDGDTGTVGRLRLWAAGDFTQRFQGFALAGIEGGQGTPDQETDWQVEQAYLRLTLGESRRTVLQGGKLILPYGNFSRRYLSTANPLIGAPLNYQISYPLGVQINGSAGRFDFMAAVLDNPLWKQDYDSEPESSPRPALAAGYTPLTGLRFGGYATAGPYLSHISQSWLFAGDYLSDFRERAYGLDVQYSAGHFELNGELTQTSLEVPYAGTARGRLWYVEPKYTLSPRWYVAARWERGNRPDSIWIWTTDWEVGRQRVQDVEAGVGFRIDPRFLVKASYRAILQDSAGTLDGNAAAIQFSYSFDVNSWFQRPR